MTRSLIFKGRDWAMKNCTVTVALLIALLHLPVPELSYAQDQDSKFDRGGFTFLVGYGAAINRHPRDDEWNTGRGGPSLGIGGFASPDVAIMWRFSGTIATNVSGSIGSAGIMAVTAQYWPSDRFNLEAGPGVGGWDIVDGKGGFGLFLGTGYIIVGDGRSSLQVALEYFPIFDTSTRRGTETFHNITFTLRYQLL